MLKLLNINYAYLKKESFKIKIPELSINEGELVYLKGPSGCGKTTLLNLVSGIIPSTIVNDVKVKFPRIEYVMHESKLLPWLNVRKNLSVFSSLNSHQINVDSFLEYCNEFSLSEKILYENPRSLSLGMRQRIEIAISLASSPNLLIIDEGLSGIDLKNKVKVTKKIFDYINTYKASLIGTAHQITDILRLANRILIMEDGMIRNEIIIDVPIEERIAMQIDKLLKLKVAGIILEN